MSRRWPLIAVVAGIALLATTVLAAGRPAGPVPEFGPAAPPDPAATSTPPPSAAAPQAPPATPRAVRPVRLAIPAIGVDTAVEATGVDDATGELAVPRDVAAVGWYRFGPDLAARAGSIVLAGHVDSAEQGAGAFFRLRDLRPGDRVTVTGTGNLTRTYTVDSRRVYAKASVPLEQLFARDGSPRLTLITCGGAFDRRAGYYRDNVVVTANPE